MGGTKSKICGSPKKTTTFVPAFFCKEKEESNQHQTLALFAPLYLLFKQSVIIIIDFD